MLTNNYILLEMDRRFWLDIMNFKIAKSAALKCLNHVVGSTDKKDFLDILSFVKIDVKDSNATFTTTNLDMQSSDSAQVVASEDFSFVAPIYTIIEIVKKLPDQAEITFSIKEDKGAQILFIKSNSFEFDLSTLPVSDFPVMPQVEFGTKIDISSQKLLDGIKKTQFSISNDDTRYQLNGLMMHSSGNVINLVSTDGHRLSVCAVEVDTAVNLENSIIPKRAVAEMSKILSGSDTIVTLQFSQNKAMLNAGNISFITKLIDGAFPDYKRVIPTSNDKVLKIASQVLAKAVERVSIANMGQDNKGMIFKVNANTMAISSKVDSCSASEAVDCEYSGSEDISMKYNYKYILDVLAHIGSENCLVKISAPESPVLIVSENSDSLKFVVMPMKM